MLRKFYKCNRCGNIVGLIHEGGGTLSCCGEDMNLLKANTSDGASEKHVPVLEFDGNRLKVKIGEVPHPMTPEHYITWICVNQNNKTQRVSLTSDDKPEAEFIVEDGPLSVYEYCNLHGLWLKEK